MDQVFVNAKVFDACSGVCRRGRSVLVTGEYIKHIGQLSECIALAKTTPEIIDLRGKVLLPAFVDTHTHFVEYAKRKIMVDLSTCDTIESVVERLRAFRASHPQLPPWILGGGWDKNKLDRPRDLNRQLMDKVFPDIPVALWSRDYHGKLANSLALKLAGIDASTADPPGGEIRRDADGQPDGLLYEAASENLEKFIVQPDRAYLKQAVRAAVSDARNYGLVGVHTMEGRLSWSILQELRDEGLSFRFCWHFPLEELDNMIAKGIRSYTGDEWLKTGGVKVFADGALGSQTAAMFEPYTGSTDCGILRYSDNGLALTGEQAASHGIALTIHGIGDKAVNQILRLYSELNQKHPGLLHRIEHVQSIRSRDLALLKASGAACALQPVHLAYDIPLIGRHWQEQQEQAYNFASIYDHCDAIGLGSDAPIETLNPFHGIYTAISRKALLDPGQSSWRPGESLTVSQALQGYTIGAAKLSQSSHIRGRIESNFYADLMVLDDYSEQPAEFWLEAKPLLLMCAGEIVELRTPGF